MSLLSWVFDIAVSNLRLAVPTPPRCSLTWSCGTWSCFPPTSPFRPTSTSWSPWKAKMTCLVTLQPTYPQVLSNSFSSMFGNTDKIGSGETLRSEFFLKSWRISSIREQAQNSRGVFLRFFGLFGGFFGFWGLIQGEGWVFLGHFGGGGASPLPPACCVRVWFLPLITFPKMLRLITSMNNTTVLLKPSWFCYSRNLWSKPRHT